MNNRISLVLCEYPCSVAQVFPVHFSDFSDTVMIFNLSLCRDVLLLFRYLAMAYWRILELSCYHVYQVCNHYYLFDYPFLSCSIFDCCNGILAERKLVLYVPNEITSSILFDFYLSLPCHSRAKLVHGRWRNHHVMIGFSCP